MNFVADFHIHSKYSRATSRDMDLESLDRWARIKGIKVLGTGDFTHPEWLKNLKNKLKQEEPGLYKLKKNDQGTRFILTSEISCIYSKNGRVRKIHIIIFAPSFKIVDKINASLNKIGNLKADGRPILGLDAKELVKISLAASKDCFIVPAHLMTPWFSLFGSKSGFDSLEECFEEYSQYIYAGETGLSADPPMLWRIPDGRRITLISNSDSHSPAKIGREANIFDTELNYYSILRAIKDKDLKEFLYTIEFFPEEGKYHYDGHRACNIVTSPKETKKYNNICPKCKKTLTIGVLNRIEKLADKPEGVNPSNAIPFKSLVPLAEIIACAIGQKTITSKGVQKEYQRLINNFGTELNILLNVSSKDLSLITTPEIQEGIIRVRQGKVLKEPGYDGVYGKISFISKKSKILNQKHLF